MRFQEIVRSYDFPDELLVKHRKSRHDTLNEKALALFSDDDLIHVEEWRQAICIASGPAKSVTSYLAAHKTLTKLYKKGILAKVSRGTYRKQGEWEL